jgi:hypothetical protein
MGLVGMRFLGAPVSILATIISIGRVGAMPAGL